MAQIKKLSTELQPLDKLLDSSGDAGTSGQILSSTGSGTNWISASSGTITGSGTTGYIPKWTGSSALGDSILEVNSALPSSVIIPEYIRHRGDTNTYFGFHSNDTFIVATSNNEVMRITSGGNVGIGTTTPGNKLHVAGGSTHDVIARFEATGTGTSDYSEIHIANNNNNRLIMGSIGSNYSGSSWSGMRYVYSTVGDLGLKAVASDGNVRIYAGSSAAERMRITSAGNVGIGTTAPTTKLEINADDDGTTDLNLLTLKRTWASGTSADRSHGIKFSDYNSTNALIYADRTNSGANYSSDLIFYTNTGSNGTNVEAKMTIKNSGNVGIGTTSPSEKLEISGTGELSAKINNTQYSRSFTITQGGGFSHLKTSHSSGVAINYGQGDAGILSLFNNTAQTIKINANGDSYFNGGDVGIGNTSPNEKLEVSGNIRASGSYKVGATDVITSGRRFYAADGSASAPAYSFSGRTDTGMFVDDHGSNDRIHFAVDGSERFNIDANGITSVSNVYTGVNGQFRNYSGIWRATTGTSGNGFIFTNTADSSDVLSITSSSSGATASVATFSGKVVSAQTASSDGNGVLTTKSYVDGLVTGVTRYMGIWDASDGTGGSPDLTASTYKVPGYYFIVSVAGDAEPNGAGTEPDTWHVGDWVIWSDQATDAWQKIDNTSVLSGTGTANKLALWNGDESLTNSRFSQNATTNIITGPGTAASDKSISVTSGNGTEQLYIQGTGEVVVTQNYFYVSASQGAYINGILRARSGVTDDGGTLGLGGNGEVNNLVLTSNTSATFAGDVTINGSHLVLANGTTEAQSTDYLYIGGNGLDSADAAIYIGNGGDGSNVGWRLYYEGTGTGNNNKFIIKSENSNNPIDALSFTQDGRASFGSTVYIPAKLQHIGDDDTFLQFSDDTITLSAGANSTTFAGSGNTTFPGVVSATEFRPTNIVTNRIVKFNGTQLDDSSITDTGSLVTFSTSLTGTNATFTAGTNTAGTPLTLGSSAQTSYTLQQFQTSSHGLNAAYFIAYGANHGSQAGNFAMKNTLAGKNIFIEVDGASRLTIDASQALFANDVKANTHFTSSDTNVTLSTNSDGTVFLRPNGKGSTTSQSTFTTALASIGTNATFAGNINLGRNLVFDDATGGINNITSATEINIGPTPSAHDATGYATVIYAGSPTTGTTNNIAGGHLWLAGGASKGTGAGGDIIFRVTPPGSSGSSLNAYATALTISDDKSASFTGNVSVIDNAKFEVGTGKDLKIWHDGSNTNIDNYTGNLSFREFAADGDMYFKADNGTGGGNITTYFYLDGGRSDGTNLATRFPDGSIILLGSGTGWNDGAQIYHSGSNLHINEYVGDIEIACHTNNGDIKFKSDDGSGGLTEYFRVDGNAELNIFYRDVFHGDNKKSLYGNNSDLQISHNGTNTDINNFTGHLNIVNAADDQDIIFYCDNGSGSNTEYFRLDGGDVRMYASREIRFVDGVASKYGNSGDLGIYHNGTDSYIENNTGELRLISNDWALRSASSQIISYDTTSDVVRISKNINFGDGHFLGDDGNDNLLLESSAGEAVLINGNTNVKLQDGGNTKLSTTSTGISVTGVIDDRDIPCLFNSNFEDAYGTSIIVVPFNNNTESNVSTRTYNHNLTMPYAGKLTKIVMKHVSGSLSSGFTTQLFLYVNGSQQASSSEISLSNDSVTWTPTASNAFSAGDVLTFAYQKSALKTFGGVSFGVAIELTDYDI